MHKGWKKLTLFVALTCGLAGAMGGAGCPSSKIGNIHWTIPFAPWQWQLPPVKPGKFNHFRSSSTDLQAAQVPAIIPTVCYALEGCFFS